MKKQFLNILYAFAFCLGSSNVVLSMIFCISFSSAGLNAGEHENEVPVQSKEVTDNLKRLQEINKRFMDTRNAETKAKLEQDDAIRKENKRLKLEAGKQKLRLKIEAGKQKKEAMDSQLATELDTANQQDLQDARENAQSLADLKLRLAQDNAPINVKPTDPVSWLSTNEQTGRKNADNLEDKRNKLAEPTLLERHWKNFKALFQPIESDNDFSTKTILNRISKGESIEDILKNDGIKKGIESYGPKAKAEFFNEIAKQLKSEFSIEEDYNVKAIDLKSAFENLLSGPNPKVTGSVGETLTFDQDTNKFTVTPSRINPALRTEAIQKVISSAKIYLDRGIKPSDMRSAIVEQLSKNSDYQALDQEAKKEAVSELLKKSSESEKDRNSKYAAQDNSIIQQRLNEVLKRRTIETERTINNIKDAITLPNTNESSNFVRNDIIKQLESMNSYKELSNVTRARIIDELETKYNKNMEPAKARMSNLLNGVGNPNGDSNLFKETPPLKRRKAFVSLSSDDNSDLDNL